MSGFASELMGFIKLSKTAPHAQGRGWAAEWAMAYASAIISGQYDEAEA